ncbi:MAG: ATP-dependent sacrificial sulfur transferase LarE [Clostridia bacterium]|nr:ATP-dependent sacrificial sulfur transferase LarE [Clostridia bacterium]
MKTFYEENPALAAKEAELAQKIAEPAKLVIALSGGVDSSLLATIAAKYRKAGTTCAITCSSCLVSEKEVAEAKAICERLGIPHIVLQTAPLAIEEVKNNDPARCYYCKKALFRAMLAEAKALGAVVLAEASHADDMGLYRPGLQALKELKIWQPLWECGFTKKDIRALAEKEGLSNAHKPAKPCYATRFPYHTELTEAKIAMVKKGEEFLEELGFSPCRLRFQHEIARIELEACQYGHALEMRAEIIIKLKELGFRYICLDLEGFRSGSMDKNIS